jgi:hypothetical protein
MSRIKRFITLLWKSIVTGLAFIIAQILVGMILGMLGLIRADAGQGSSMLGWMFLAAIMMGLTLGLFAERINVRLVDHILIWGSIIFLNLGSVMLEGAYFAPELVTLPLPVLLIQQFLVSILTALVISLLFAPRPFLREKPAFTLFHDTAGFLWRFLICAVVYLVCYYVFGSLNYSLVTRPYYETLAGGLAVPAALTVLFVEMIRAPVIVLSVIPFLMFSQDARKKNAVNTGLILFLIGGVVPLFFQAGSLPAVLLLASGVEIFLQNFTAGFVSGWMLGGNPGGSNPSIQSVD